MSQENGSKRNWFSGIPEVLREIPVTHRVIALIVLLLVLVMIRTSTDTLAFGIELSIFALAVIAILASEFLGLGWGPIANEAAEELYRTLDASISNFDRIDDQATAWADLITALKADDPWQSRRLRRMLAKGIEWRVMRNQERPVPDAVKKLLNSATRARP